MILGGCMRLALFVWLCLFLLAGCGLESLLGWRNGPNPPDPNAPPQTGKTIGGRTPEPGSAVPVPREVRVMGRFTAPPTRMIPEPDEIPQLFMVSGEATVIATPELPHALDLSTATETR